MASCARTGRIRRQPGCARKMACGGPPQHKREDGHAENRSVREVPMAIVGGLDVHRKQITFDYLDTSTGEVRRGRVPGTRLAFREWLGRLAARPGAFAVEGCTGWRFVVEELRRAGMTAHLAEPADT